MFERIVVYSPLSRLSAQFVQKLGLLYDRVVIPLPDAIRSGRIQWLNELAEACEYTQGYLKGLDAVYSDESGFCRPLDMTEYTALAMDSEMYRRDFHRFVEGNISHDEWSGLLEKGIDVAQDVLNFYVTQDYAKELKDAGVSRNFVFPFREDGGVAGAMVSKIGSVLGIEAARCALHGFDLPNSAGEFRTILSLSRGMESKYALKRRLYDAEKEIEAAAKELTSSEEMKELLRSHVLKLTDSYNEFIEDLGSCGKVVKVRRRRGSNALRVARRLVRPKWNSEAEGKFGFLRVALNLEDQYANEYREMLKEAGEAVMGAEHRWQCDLLTLRCDVDREFGREETYKILSPGIWDYVRSVVG